MLYSSNMSTAVGARVKQNAQVATKRLHYAMLSQSTATEAAQLSSSQLLDLQLPKWLSCSFTANTTCFSVQHDVTSNVSHRL